MRRIPTDEEKKLREIYKHYMDPKTLTLCDDAPKEAKDALEKCKEIAHRIKKTQLCCRTARFFNAESD